MRILGVDPGTWRTGVGMIETSGNCYRLLHCEIIAIRNTPPLAERLRTIYHRLSIIIKQYQPDALALENIFYAKNVHSMVKIGEARACAMLAASEQGVDVIEYQPTRVKQAVSGNGRASKEQVQAMVKTLLNLKEAPPTDGADALAVAICHCHHYKDQGMRERNKRFSFIRTTRSKNPLAAVKR